MNKTHWQKWYNPNYLGAWAFNLGEEKTVTIKQIVDSEEVQSQRGKELCRVAHFVEDVKPLILNKTNSRMIAKVWGTPYIEDWAGLKIVLKVKKVKSPDGMVDAVRVSSERPMENYICAECGCVITSASGRDAKTIAEATEAKYGRTLCMDCARKEKATNE